MDKVGARTFEEKRYEYHKRLQEDFFSVYHIAEIRTYRVKNGDNLWALSLGKFNIPMWLLKSCNPEVDFADLRLRQTLMIPVIEKIEIDSTDMDTLQETDDADRQEHHISIL